MIEVGFWLAGREAQIGSSLSLPIDLLNDDLRPQTVDTVSYWLHFEEISDAAGACSF